MSSSEIRQIRASFYYRLNACVMTEYNESIIDNIQFQRGEPELTNHLNETIYEFFS